MTTAEFRVRRATVDDLPALKALWESMRITTPELDKRLTEFQVAEMADGKVAAAIGIQIVQRQALIHSEAFVDFSIADQVRAQWWTRIQSLAMNHGIVRLWTQEHAPFWTHNGFQPANAANLEKLAPAWDHSVTDWLVLQLKEEAAIQALSADAEFAAYMKAEREKTAAKARTAKRVGVVVALLFALFTGALMLYAFMRDPGMIQRLLHR